MGQGEAAPKSDVIIGKPLIPWTIQSFLFDRETLSFYRKRNLQYALNELTAYLDFAHCKTLEDVTPQTMRGFVLWLRGKGQNAVTINCKVSAVRTFFRFCLQEGYLTRDPSESLRKLREPQVEIRTLTKADVVALLGQADRRTFTGLRDYWIILTLYDTGLRVSELCTLKLGDIDWGKQQFRIMGKGSKERRVPFSPQVRRAGLAYLQQRPEVGHDYGLVTNSGAPFISKDKNRNGPNRIQHMLKAYAKKAELRAKVTPHIFRHTFAVEYLRANVGDIYRLREILGHSTLTMVMRYLHFVERDIRLGHMKASPASLLRVPV